MRARTEYAIIKHVYPTPPAEFLANKAVRLTDLNLRVYSMTYIIIMTGSSFHFNTVSIGLEFFNALENIFKPHESL
jgi:hypothetical protein